MDKENISLAEKAYILLEEMIVTLKLPPGRVFSEADLSKAINIGRTPMRESLQRLAVDRLVTTIPRKGVMVTDVNISEHIALLDTRRVLERLIAARAAKRSTPEHRDALRECGAAMMAAAADGDATEFMKRDREFDQILREASRNAFAARATEPLRAHCRRFWYVYRNNGSNGDLKESAQAHVDLMNAVAEKNVKEAEACSDRLMDYLDNFTKAVLDH